MAHSEGPLICGDADRGPLSYEAVPPEVVRHGARRDIGGRAQ
jgi:hypothetical protein